MTVVFVHDELMVCGGFILGYIMHSISEMSRSLLWHFMISSLYLLLVAVFHFLIDKGIHHGPFSGKHARRAFVYSFVRM